ncbi:MAG: toxin-antitoxin system YwqK family antitoxin, partial [Fusobacterium varium]
VKNIANFIEDKINGVSKTYYENGQIEGEYTFIDNQFDGLFRKYSKDGKITNEAIFKKGKVEKIIK